MGLFDLFDSFTGDGFGSSILDIGQAAVGGFAQNLNVGQTVSYPVYQPTYPMQQYPEPQPVMASVPMVARAAASGIAAWSVRYPSLWQAIQKMRGNGAKVTIDRLYSMMRQWGPTALAGVIGSGAVAELISYKTTHKSRRMNVANTRALRRSLRRLKGFDRLSHRVSTQLSTSCRSPRRSRFTKKC